MDGVADIELAWPVRQARVAQGDRSRPSAPTAIAVVAAWISRRRPSVGFYLVTQGVAPRIVEIELQALPLLLAHFDLEGMVVRVTGGDHVLGFLAGGIGVGLEEIDRLAGARA